MAILLRVLSYFTQRNQRDHMDAHMMLNIVYHVAKFLNDFLFTFDYPPGS